MACDLPHSQLNTLLGQCRASTVDNRDYGPRWTEDTSDNSLNVSSPWTYSEPGQLAAGGTKGWFETYPSEGYVFDWSDSQQGASTLATLKELRNQSWIDENTRAVSVELTLFNPTLNLHTVVLVLFEFLNVGGVAPYTEVLPCKLYQYTTLSDIYAFICGTVYIVLLLLFTYGEWKKFHYARTSRKYFTRLSTCLSLAVLVLSYTAIGLFVKRAVVITRVRSASTDTFINFYEAAQWDLFLINMLGILSSLLLFSLLKLLSLSHHMMKVLLSVKVLLKTIWGLSAWAFITAVAFLAIASLVMMPSCESFSSLTQSLMSLTSMAGRRSRYVSDSCLDCDGKMLHSAIFFLTCCVVLVIWIPMLRAILNIKLSSQHLFRKEMEFAQYLLHRLLLVVGLADINILDGGTAQTEDMSNDSEEEDMSNGSVDRSFDDRAEDELWDFDKLKTTGIEAARRFDRIMKQPHGRKLSVAFGKLKKNFADLPRLSLAVQADSTAEESSTDSPRRRRLTLKSVFQLRIHRRGGPALDAPKNSQEGSEMK